MASSSIDLRRTVGVTPHSMNSKFEELHPRMASTRQPPCNAEAAQGSAGRDDSALLFDWAGVGRREGKFLASRTLVQLEKQLAWGFRKTT